MSTPAIDGADPVAIAQALIGCASVTPVDAGALGVLAGVLKPLGFRCHHIPLSAPETATIDNLYARLGTLGPHLCFAGHTDVVPPGDYARWRHPPFDAVIENGVLHGRGAVDMKGAIACFVAAVARSLARHGAPPRGSISLLITGDEEGPGINGTRKLVGWLRERGEIPDQCIVGEPTNPRAVGDEIKIGRRGSLNGWLSVRGRQGHVAYPALAANPITGLIKATHALTTIPLDEGSAHFARSNLEITTIDVGNPTVNIIPAHAVARFNVRYNDRHTAESLEALLYAEVAPIIAGAGLSFDLRFERSGDAFLTDPDATGQSEGRSQAARRLVTVVSRAVQTVTGRMPELTTSGGTSDARFIKDLCPVVEFGLVNATIHQIDECARIADLEALTDIYGHVLENYFG